MLHECWAVRLPYLRLSSDQGCSEGELFREKVAIENFIHAPRTRFG